MLTGKEVAEHSSRQSCWVVISGQVYDLTSFIDDHPGGPNVILRYAGKDATEEYAPIHPPGTITKSLSKDKHLGSIDMSTVYSTVEGKIDQKSPAPDIIPLKMCQSLLDIENVASKCLTQRAYTYFHSASESLSSLEANRRDWSRVSFRPRVMRNVAKVSMRCTIMGQESSSPFFIAPTAMVKLANKHGEVGLARASALKNIPYAVSTYSSCSHEEIMESLVQDQLPNLLFFQLYVPRRRDDAIKLITKARLLGFKALLVTVDTPVVGKREEDDRFKAETDYKAGIEDSPRTTDTSIETEQPVLRGVHSSTLSWDDLSWIREAWAGTGPIVLKGIQSAEDALLAYRAGVDAIYLSNHGGRQLDFAPSALHTLLEIRRFCPEVLGKMGIYLDGGVRRGSDILKAICLGATAVALGRPFIYALGAYGIEGVIRAIELLSEEAETTLRLLGVNALNELDANFVNTKALEHDIVDSVGKLDINGAVLKGKL